MKISKIIKKPKVLILIFFIVVSLIAINPQLNAKGISIKYIEKDSAAQLAGMQGPTSETSPTNYERILEINNIEIKTIQDYSDTILQYNPGDTIRITTDKQEYTLIKKLEDIGIKVQKVATTNIRTGLELSGGTRVVLRPETQITDLERDNLIQMMEYRLNTYGLSDIEIRKADGQPIVLGGEKEKYIIVEIAGATEQEVSELIASQGLFEAKIANQTVFTGGENDITYVCRNDGTCSGVRDCAELPEGGHHCKFEFVIHLSSSAAKRHAEVTSNLEIIDGYLSEKIDFYLDEKLVDSLNIAGDLKGVEATQIMISGPGLGETRQEAIQEALDQMNKLQTILLTGSLPIKLEIIKLDTISPILGEEFVRNAMLVGLLAIGAVSIIIFLKYKNLKITIPVLIALLSEVVIILGFSALIKYNLDLAAIAGIIAAVGTGVDDQIVIIDEVTRGELGYSYRWKDRLKKAFFIIFAAWATTVAAMIPLFSAGAGLLRGFALITIIGITSGVFITRPAFAAIMEKLIEE